MDEATPAASPGPEVSRTDRCLGLQRQTRRLRQRLVELQRSSYRLGWLRLALFLATAGAGAAALFLTGWWLFWPVLLIGLVAFGVAVFYHRRLEASITRHAAGLEFQLAQMARMELDWAGIPALASPRPNEAHPFETDLDLVGERSVHRLLDTAVSLEASQRLGDWLTTPEPDLDQIRRRQALVRELTPLSLFRNRLILNATIAAGSQKMWDAQRLLTWLSQEPPLQPLRRWLWVLGGLAVVNWLFLALNRLALAPPLWQFTFPIYLGLVLWASRLAGDLLGEAVALQESLHQLGAVFRQLETFSYRHTPYLAALCTPFRDRLNRPSRYLARLTRLAAAVGLRSNPFLWLILNAALPWDVALAWLIGRAKQAMADPAPAWLEAWFELETLGSLANLAYLNPDYTLPTVTTGDGPQPGPVFRAKSLGHPLIPADKRVCNDFEIAHLGEVVIITGSNMAGKSTFLRTVGVNLALAYAGGPVDARLLQTRLFRLFSSIRVSDSVTDGISYFYAEVKRLKALLSALEEDHALPLFFFIDEIFRGTNNRERFLGSRAYLEALVGQHGVGLVATHDLELARLADQMPQLANYHFRDDFRNGRMVFDYILQPGPCPTTNALKIMQLAGLPVK